MTPPSEPWVTTAPVTESVVVATAAGKDDPRRSRACVANLAVVSTIGAFAAMAAQPMAGQISDRTRSLPTRWAVQPRLHPVRPIQLHVRRKAIP